MDYDELNSVYCDFDGNMWLATDNGAFVLIQAENE
jgi:ligand-binding sensor domain-containing protein